MLLYITFQYLLIVLFMFPTNNKLIKFTYCHALLSTVRMFEQLIDRQFLSQ